MVFSRRRVQTLSSLCVVVGLCLFRVSNAIPEDDNNLLKLPVDLSDSDFDSSIQDGRTWVVMFYAPWCGHCKRTKPAWDQLARSPALISEEVQVARIDGSADGSKSMQKWAVQRARQSSYPTILRFHKEQVWVFGGERRFASLEDWSLNPGDELAEPGTFTFVLDQIQMWVGMLVRWASAQSVAVVVGLVVLLGVLVGSVGFLLGFYWREWQTEFCVNIRWGASGEFVPFALIPLDPSSRLVRKDSKGVEMKLEDKSGEVFCCVRGHHFWIPDQQQLDPAALPASWAKKEQ